MLIASVDKATKFKVSCRLRIRTFISRTEIVSPTAQNRIRYVRRRCSESWPRSAVLATGVHHRNHCLHWRCAKTHPRNSADVIEISHSTNAVDQYHQRRLSLVQKRSHTIRRHCSAASVCEDRRCVLHRSWTVSDARRECCSSCKAFFSPLNRINQPGLAEATEYLIQAFYGFEAPLVKVTCQTEVSEQYHVYLQTRQQSKDMCIAAIEQYTHTTIQFPGIINSNISQDSINNYGRRTSVTITGSPTQVCQARKLFDVRENDGVSSFDMVFAFSFVYQLFWLLKYPSTKSQVAVSILAGTISINSSRFSSLAQTAHIKDKLNVTTTVRTRKDKIGKVNLFRSVSHRRSHLSESSVSDCSIAGVQLWSAVSSSHGHPWFARTESSSYSADQYQWTVWSEWVSTNDDLLITKFLSA